MSVMVLLTKIRGDGALDTTDKEESWWGSYDARCWKDVADFMFSDGSNKRIAGACCKAKRLDLSTV